MLGLHGRVDKNRDAVLQEVSQALAPAPLGADRHDHPHVDAARLRSREPTHQLSVREEHRLNKNLSLGAVDRRAEHVVASIARGEARVHPGVINVHARGRLLARCLRRRQAQAED